MYCPDFRLSSFSFVASYGLVTLATSGFWLEATDASEARLVREGEGEGGTVVEGGTAAVTGWQGGSTVCGCT